MLQQRLPLCIVCASQPVANILPHYAFLSAYLPPVFNLSRSLDLDPSRHQARKNATAPLAMHGTGFLGSSGFFGYAGHLNTHDSMSFIDSLTFV
tara:strand:- start:1511 stop:1792 length:282 start_codon:yes stop_codon:yes gene_type:complete